MAEKQDAKHECWYQPKLRPQLMDWDMEDIWLLIGKSRDASCYGCGDDTLSRCLSD